MHLHQHLVLSAAAGGGLAAATGQPELIGITIAAGVLPDADHAIDFGNWYLRGNTDRLILLFHGWEYLALAIGLYLFVFTDPWMAAVAVGYATQIGTDQVFNRPRWNTYFIASRAANRFRWEGVISRRPADYAYQSLLASVPVFREPITRWFERRVLALPGFQQPTSDQSRAIANGSTQRPPETAPGEGD